MIGVVTVAHHPSTQTVGIQKPEAVAKPTAFVLYEYTHTPHTFLCPPPLAPTFVYSLTTRSLTHLERHSPLPVAADIKDDERSQTPTPPSSSVKTPSRPCSYALRTPHYTHTHTHSQTAAFRQRLLPPHSPLPLVACPLRAAGKASSGRISPLLPPDTPPPQHTHTHLFASPFDSRKNPEQTIPSFLQFDGWCG